MSLNRIINMLTRMVSRKTVNRGVEWVAKSGGKPVPVSAKQSRDTRAAVKRARQAAKLTRRSGR